jgi:iron complex outermembrane recepter protein
MLSLIRTSRWLVTSLLCLGVMLCHTASAQSQRFDLPAQSLARSLNSIGSLPGLTLLYNSAPVEGKQARALHGDWSVDAVLEVLLEGTGLHARRINAHTINVEKDAAHPPAIAPSSLKVRKPASAPPISPPRQGVEEVIVTGSRFQDADGAGMQVIVHDRTDIERSGARTVEEFLRWMPENFGSVASLGIFGAQINGTGRNVGGDNNTDGTGFDIHGLGAAQTLTLVDGHRVSAAGANGEFVDVSLVPLSAVERIEVLPYGESAVYGSDAVAGVVNIILRRDYVGAETTVSDSGASHGGDHKWVASQLFGRDWGTGTRAGGIWLAYEFDQQGGLRANERGTIPVNYGDGLGDTLLYPEQTLHSLWVKGHQEISDSTQLSGDLMYSQRRYYSVNQAPALNQSIDSQGVSRMYGMTLDVTQALGTQWKLDLSAGAYRTDQPASQVELSSGLPPQLSTVGSRWGLIQIPLVVEGPMCSLPAGDVKWVVGAELRKETEAASLHVSADAAGDPPIALSKGFGRNIHGVFSELSIPLLDKTQSNVGLRKLELWLAERYDHYSVGGSAGTPKIGLVWSPAQDSVIRASYTQAFVAPRFDELAQSNPLYQTVAVDNPQSPTGKTDTLEQTNGNPALRPERSETYAFGIEQQLAAVPGLSAYSTYFNTTFKSQIAQPPYLNPADLLHDPQLHGFVDLTPNPAQIAEWFNEGEVRDTVGLGAAAVQATLDLRYANLAITRESGIDLGAVFKHTFSTATTVGMSLRGEYLFRDKTQAQSTAPVVTLLNRLGEPINLHLNTALDASYHQLSGALSVLYVNHYENPLFSPPRSIGSWTTINLHTKYEFGRDTLTVLRGVSLSVDITNLFDRRPPGIQLPPKFRNFNPGFDGANADPFGQVIGLQLRKCW